MFLEKSVPGRVEVNPEFQHIVLAFYEDHISHLFLIYFTIFYGGNPVAKFPQARQIVSK
jgi:hypothetical protein